MNTSTRTRSLRPSPLVLGALLGFLGCTSPQNSPVPAPPPHADARVELSNEYTATAEVVDIEREQRSVTLRRENGSLFALQVGTAARNFDQLAVGDHVRVNYRESMAASLRPSGETVHAAEAAFGAGRTPAGDKPGGGLGLAVSARVEIESVDLARDIVVFSLASGELIAHRIATSEGREFARSLAVGDVVQLDYTEALALSVERL